MITISELVIGLVIISMVATGFVGFYTDVATRSGLDLGDQENLTTFRQMDLLLNQTNNTQTAMKDSSNNLPFNDIAALMINGYNALKTGLLSINIFKAMITDATNIMGLPSWIATGVWAVILIVITFALAAIVLKWRV